MTMNKRLWKALLLATMTVMLCVLIITGATFALFTDSVNLTNHLVAGKLDVQLVRTKLDWMSINSNGYLEKHSNTTETDLSNITTTNVFGLTNETYIAPTAYYEATLKLKNNGNVAFNYSVTFKLNATATEKAANEALLKQLVVTIKDSTDTTVVNGVSLYDIIDQNIPVESVASSQVLDNTKLTSPTFKVRVEFKDDGRPTSANPETFVNNNAMTQQAKFDLVVTAVQAAPIN